MRESRRINNIEYGADTVPFWVQQIKENPDSISLMPDKLRSTVGVAFNKQYGLPLPKPLEGQGKAQETAARIAQDNIAYVRNVLNNPEIAKQIGPILGRLGEAEQATGAA